LRRVIVVTVMSGMGVVQVGPGDLVADENEEYLKEIPPDSRRRSTFTNAFGQWNVNGDNQQGRDDLDHHELRDLELVTENVEYRQMEIPELLSTHECFKDGKVVCILHMMHRVGCVLACHA